MTHNLADVNVHIKIPEKGDFSWIKSSYARENLSDMYQAVTVSTPGWSFFDQNPPENKGYCWWDHSDIKKIMEKCKISHSGTSFSLSMNAIRTIHQNGWINFYFGYNEQ